MDESPDPPDPDRVVELVESGEHDEAATALARLADAPTGDRNEAVRGLRRLADDRPGAVRELLPAVAPFLTDEERSIRLAAAKLSVAVARADPAAAVPVVDSLADRLADDGEFYYVRARTAEALGYVALDDPDAVAAPEVLADMRVGLEFDQPEVAAKLAKALEYVAIGDPGRLRHQVPRLVPHLDDGPDPVRYHLCTALVAVGSEHPGALTDAVDALAARLDDPQPHVRGRAAEALGLAAGAGATVPAAELEALADDDESFVVDRVRFALSMRGDDPAGPTAFGSVQSVRETTETALEAMTTPDTDGQCPACGLDIPEAGPPMCPRCGAPR